MVSARQVSALNPKWRILALEPKQQAQSINTRARQFELFDISDPSEAGSVYFGRLDEGDYDVIEVRSFGPGPGLLLALLAADSQSLRSQVGSVHVAAGKLVDLGTLVLQPALESDGPPPSAELLDGPVGRKSAMDDLERRAGRKVDLPLEGAGGDAAAEQQALARARAMIALIGWGDSAQGGLLGGAPLGQIAALGAGGRWRIEMLDSLDDVKYARRLADGTLIAGFVQGRYAVRRPGQGWTYLNLPNRDTVVAYTDATPDGGALFVVSSLSKTLVLKRASLDAPESEIRVVLTLDFPVHARPNPVLQLEEGILIVENHSGFSRVADLTFIDRQTLEAKKTSVDFWIRSWQRMPSGEIVASRQNGMSYYKAVSADRGVTWVRGQVEGPLEARYLDAERGYGLNVSPNALSITLQLMKTADGGKSWTMAGPSMNRKGGASRLIYVSEGEVIAAVGAEMLSTRDEGKTWTRVVLRDATAEAAK